MASQCKTSWEAFGAKRLKVSKVGGMQIYGEDCSEADGNSRDETLRQACA